MKKSLHEIVKGSSGYELLEEIANLKGDVNKYEHGFTPVLLAVMKGNLNIVQILVDNGADALKTDANRRSPLWLAAYNGHTAIVRYLLELQDIDIEAGDIWENRSPLWVAAAAGHIEIVEVLAAVGADLNKVNKDGVSALAFSCYNRNMAILNLLILKGADVFLADHSGYTPMQLVKRYGYKSFEKVLAVAESRKKMAPATKNWNRIRLTSKVGRTLSMKSASQEMEGVAALATLNMDELPPNSSSRRGSVVLPPLMQSLDKSSRSTQHSG